MSRTIGGQTVLPDLPHAPRMVQFPPINLAADTLPAFNAMGQGLVPNAPLPSPTMVGSPSYTIPQGQGINMNEAVMGGGYGQGVVPNSPRPSSPEIKFAEFSVPLGSDASTNLGNDNLRGGQNITPEAQYLRPSHTMEVYGSGPEMNVSHLNRVKPETHIPNTLIHNVTENFGNNPAHEVNRASMSRPPNPRRLFNAPSVKVAPSVKRVSLRQAPVLPRANLPKQINFTALVPPSSGLRFESEYVAPPVRATDLGGLTPSRHRQIGVNAGRTFGAEGHLL